MQRLRDLSIKKIIGVLVLVSMVILIINFFVIYRVTQLHQKQERVINIAGRQRMLTQKMTKEALLLLHDDYSQEILKKTMTDFNNNLEDLKEGNLDRNLPPTKNRLIMIQQQKITEMWKKFKNMLEIIMSNKSTIPEKGQALTYLKENNLELLNEVDKAVELYEDDSIQYNVIAIELLILVFSLLVLLVTWIVVNNIINKSRLDKLTNIYTRAVLVHELEQEISRADRYNTELGLIMFDIDHFKKVNDRFGHDVGDMVLVNLTKIVSGMIRNTDTFARWGGEEFMILVPNTDLVSTERQAGRLRAAIARHKFGSVGRVTCSFGVAEFKQSDDLDTFIKRVDQALYKAKDQGRNRVVSF